MSAAIFDPLVLPEGWFSPAAGVSPQSWFDADLADNTVYTAILSVTLDPATLTSTLQAEVRAALAETLGEATVVSAAQVDVLAALTATLGAATLAAVAQAEARADLSATLGPATVSGTTVAEVHASLQGTLGPASLSSSAVVDVAAGAFVLLDPATSSAAATVAVQGTLGTTLGPATLFSEAVVSFGSPRFVDADIRLGAATLSATATAQVSAALSTTLGAATLVSSIARHRLGFGGSLRRTLLTVKEGDLEPPVVLPITDVLGNSVDLTLAQSVAFRMALTLDRVEVFSRPAVVDDAASGVVSYTWRVGDTVPGVYYAEFAVTWPGDRVETYPQTGYLVVVVEPRV